MKYFDAHAHIFPAKVAGKVIRTLENFYGYSWEGSGEEEDLLASMEESRVDHALVFSCATKAEQVETINDYIASVAARSGGRFIGLGTMHPDYPDPAAELERIRRMGLLGLKIHTDFQRIYLDEPKMFAVYALAQDLSLPVLFHVGDVRFDFSSPWRVARILKNFPRLKVIAAHFGGYQEWDESWKYLAGKNLWFDTSSTLPSLPLHQVREIARKHGAEKLLFASDYPVTRHTKAIQDVLSLGFSDAENEMIFYKNAEALFGKGRAAE